RWSACCGLASMRCCPSRWSAFVYARIGSAAPWLHCCARRHGGAHHDGGVTCRFASEVAIVKESSVYKQRGVRFWANGPLKQAVTYPGDDPSWSIQRFCRQVKPLLRNRRTHTTSLILL